MALLILLALIAIPLVEIAVFIQIGGMIGVFPTIALCILSAMTGTALMRYQGLATIARVRESLERNILPLDEVFDGLCILLAGGLLLLPGFVSDVLGLLLFLPPVRSLLKAAMARHLTVVEGRSGSGQPPRGPQGPRVIETDYEDITPEDRPPGER